MKEFDCGTDWKNIITLDFLTNEGSTREKLNDFLGIIPCQFSITHEDYHC